MPTKIRAYSKEVGPKGKCYLVVEQYDAEDFSAVLDELIVYYRARGAQRISIAAKMKSNLTLSDGMRIGAHTFSYDVSFNVYEKTLIADSGRTLRLKSITESNAPLYQAIFNEAFFAVPNSETLLDLDIKELLLDGRRDAGFIMLGGEPMGVFELNYHEEVPEIAAIALLSSFRGAGHGENALRSLEKRLYEKGYGRVQLLVASTNADALKLYEKSGYQISRHVSDWFLIQDDSATTR